MLSLQLRGLVLGSFTPKSPLVSLAHVFHSIPLQEKVLGGSEIKNPVLRTRLFFVDKRFEISNLDLLRDLVMIVDFLSEK